MKTLKRPSLDQLELPDGPVLLVNSPAVDVRLPWARWLQPLGLLQLGTALRQRGRDVRLIDCLLVPASSRLPKERVGAIKLAGITINVWRFGLAPGKVVQQVRTWAKEGWTPASVLVSCQTSAWWRGAKELIAALRPAVTGAVFLGGPYVSAYPEHAAEQAGADVLVVGPVAEAEDSGRDLALYRPGRMPWFAGLPLLASAAGPGGGPSLRPADDIAEEVKQKAALGVTTFAFFDDCLGPGRRDGLRAATEGIAALDLARAGFVVVGNFSPRLIDRDLAKALRAARFRQVSLRDDLVFGSTGVGCASTDEDYARAMAALHAAGYRPRTDQVSAAIVAGFPDESLASVVARLVCLASIVGSVNLVPYQYTPGGPGADRYADLVAGATEFADPAALNAQLYPLARRSGSAIEEYWELTRLAALLNSKHRSQTFDFRSKSLIAHLLHRSLADRRWDPIARRTVDVPILATPGWQPATVQRSQQSANPALSVPNRAPSGQDAAGGNQGPIGERPS